jgi:hypothetical protein
MLTGAFTRLVTHLTFKVVDIPAVASAVGQVASALVAIPVAVLAYFAYQISKNSAEATTALTNIERVRLQGELHPRLELKATPSQGRFDWVLVEVTLAGPPTLSHLDSIELHVHPEIFPSHSGDHKARSEEVWLWGVEKSEDLIDNPSYGPIHRGETFVGILKAAGSKRSLPETDSTVNLLLTAKLQGFDPWVVAGQVQFTREADVIKTPVARILGRDVESWQPPPTGSAYIDTQCTPTGPNQVDSNTDSNRHGQ